MNSIVVLFCAMIGVVLADVNATTNLFKIIDQNNVLCGMVNASIVLKIKYMNDFNKSVVANVPVPGDLSAVPIRDCKSLTHDVQLTPFYNNWQLTLGFTKDKTLIHGDTDGKQWALESITGYYDSAKAPAFFPNITLPIENAFNQNYSDSPVHSQLNYTYSCLNEPTMIKVDNFVTLEFQELKAQPFSTGNKTDFDILTTCLADQKTSDLVPIIVGASLAVLVIVVLVAYIIGRIRAKRQGYSSV